MAGNRTVTTPSPQLEYWLPLSPKEILQAKLHKAIEEAKLRLEAGDE